MKFDKWATIWLWSSPGIVLLWYGILGALKPNLSDKLLVVLLILWAIVCLVAWLADEFWY